MTEYDPITDPQTLFDTIADTTERQWVQDAIEYEGGEWIPSTDIQSLWHFRTVNDGFVILLDMENETFTLVGDWSE